MTSYETVKDLFEKMAELERRVNLNYSKAFFINKIDLVKSEDSKETLKNIIKDIKTLKEKYNLDSHEYYLMSALNGRGVLDSVKKLIAKIHQKKSEERQNEGLKDENIDDSEDGPEVKEIYLLIKIAFNDKIQLFSRRIFCGNNLFTCLAPVIKLFYFISFDY